MAEPEEKVVGGSLMSSANNPRNSSSMVPVCGIAASRSRRTVCHKFIKCRLNCCCQQGGTSTNNQTGIIEQHRKRKFGDVGPVPDDHVSRKHKEQKVSRLCSAGKIVVANRQKRGECVTFGTKRMQNPAKWNGVQESKFKENGCNAISGSVLKCAQTVFKSGVCSSRRTREKQSACLVEHVSEKNVTVDMQRLQQYGCKLGGELKLRIFAKYSAPKPNADKIAIEKPSSCTLRDRRSRKVAVQVVNRPMTSKFDGGKADNIESRSSNCMPVLEKCTIRNNSNAEHPRLTCSSPVVFSLVNRQHGLLTPPKITKTKQMLKQRKASRANELRMEHHAAKANNSTASEKNLCKPVSVCLFSEPRSNLSEVMAARGDAKVMSSSNSSKLFNKPPVTKNSEIDSLAAVNDVSLESIRSFSGNVTGESIVSTALHNKVNNSGKKTNAEVTADESCDDDECDIIDCDDSADIATEPTRRPLSVSDTLESASANQYVTYGIHLLDVGPISAGPQENDVIDADLPGFSSDSDAEGLVGCQSAPIVIEEEQSEGSTLELDSSDDVALPIARGSESSTIITDEEAVVDKDVSQRIDGSTDWENTALLSQKFSVLADSGIACDADTSSVVCVVSEADSSFDNDCGDGILSLTKGTEHAASCCCNSTVLSEGKRFDDTATSSNTREGNSLPSDSNLSTRPDDYHHSGAPASGPCYQAQKMDTCEWSGVVRESSGELLVEENEDANRSVSVAICSSIAAQQNVNDATDVKPSRCTAADGDHLAVVNLLPGSEPSCAYKCAEPQQPEASLAVPTVRALVDITADQVESIVVDSLVEETEPDPLLSESEELLILSDLMQMQQSDVDEDQLGSLISELTEVETLIRSSPVEDLRPQLFDGSTSGAFFPATNETPTMKPVCKTFLPAVTDFSVVSALIGNVKSTAEKVRCSDSHLESTDGETVLLNAALAEQTNHVPVIEDCCIGGWNSVHASFETTLAEIARPEAVVEVKSLVAASDRSSDFESHNSGELCSSSSKGALEAVGSRSSSPSDKLFYASAPHELLSIVDELSSTVGSKVETCSEYSAANNLKANLLLAELNVTGVSAQDILIETQDCVIVTDKQQEKLMSDPTAVDSLLHDTLSPRKLLPIFLPSNAVGEQLPVLDTNVEELLVSDTSAPDDGAGRLSPQSFAAEIARAVVESVLTNHGQCSRLNDDTRQFVTAAGETETSSSCIEGPDVNMEPSSATDLVGDNAIIRDTAPTTACNVSSTEADSSEIVSVNEASSALKCEKSSNLIAETDASRCMGGLNEAEVSRSFRLSALGRSLLGTSDVNVAFVVGSDVVQVQSFNGATDTITGEISTPCQHVDELSAIGLDLVDMRNAEVSVSDILVTSQKLMVDNNIERNTELCYVKIKETSVIGRNSSNNTNSCQVGPSNEVSSQKFESSVKDLTAAGVQGAKIASSGTVLINLNETSLDDETCVTKDDNIIMIGDSVQLKENFERELQLLPAADRSCMLTKNCRSNVLFPAFSREDEITNGKTDAPLQIAEQLYKAFDLKPHSSTTGLGAPASADDSGAVNELDNGSIDSSAQSTADITVEIASSTLDGTAVNTRRLTESDDIDEDSSRNGCLFEEELDLRLDSSATDLLTCSASVSESTLADLVTESPAVAATAEFHLKAPTAIESETTCQIPLPLKSNGKKSLQLLADAVRPRHRCRTSSEHTGIVQAFVVEIPAGRSVRQRSSTLTKLQSVYEVANLRKKSRTFVNRSKLITESSGEKMPSISPLNAARSKRRKSEVVSSTAANGISGVIDAISVALPPSKICQENCSTPAIPDSAVSSLSVGAVDNIAAADEPGGGATGSIEEQRKISKLETSVAVDTSTDRARRHSDGHASAAGQTSSKSVEQPTRRKSDAQDLKHVSTKLTDIGGRIKRSLSLEHTNIDHCVAAMSEVDCLMLTQAVIAKHPDFLVTIKKCRKYKGSDRVRSKADEIYVRCKQLCMEPDCFNSNADIQETPLSKGSALDHQLLVRNTRRERISSESHQSTMLDSSRPKPPLFKHHRQQQPVSDDSIDGTHSVNTPASTSCKYVEMKGFSVNGPPRRISHYASLRQLQNSADSPSLDSRDENSLSTSGKRRSSASTSTDTVRLTPSGSGGSSAAEKSLQNSRFPTKKDSSWSCDDDDDVADERNRLRPDAGNNNKGSRTSSKTRSSVESGRSILSCTAPVEVGTWSSSSSSAFLPLQSVGAVGDLLSAQKSAIDENSEDGDRSSGYSLDDDDDNESSGAAAAAAAAGGGGVLEYKSELEARIAQIIAEEDAEIMTSEVVHQPAATPVIPPEQPESYSPRSPGEDSDVIDDEELHILLGV